MVKKEDNILLSWQLPTIVGIVAALLVVMFRKALLSGMSVYLQVVVVIMVSMLVGAITRMVQEHARSAK